MPYIDWEYYSSLFDNITDEKAFNRTYAKAEVYMDRYTAMRARAFLKAYDEDNATDFQNMTANAVKMTMCEIINNIAVQEASEMGTGIASVSNEGYSESYRITTASEKEAQLLCIIRNGLSGTGLAGAL
ncbi:MAG: hypothetical protein OSJ61_11210 [Lachnospiraceae bacterium]|jgi:hypothetical protein|nr:hypothetical protein [Lachnospiraceae bacterium]